MVGLLTVDAVRVVATVLHLVEVEVLLLPHPHWRPPHHPHLPLLHHHFAKIRKTKIETQLRHNFIGVAVERLGE